MKSVAELVLEIRQQGGRVTPQRIAVIEAINKSMNHPTVDDIYERVVKTQKSLSKKTVYQIVNDLNTIGAVSLIDVGTGQIRIETNTENDHDHFVCVDCSCIYDVDKIKRSHKNITNAEYGNIESIEVVYRGKCKNCVSMN